MALSKKPVTGMKDILPGEMRIREYVIGVIRETYAAFGFTSIETPCVENIANLSSRQGGENEKLIFKILRRGEKLKLEEAQTEADVTDSGLRYDLTVPLVRFYSAHTNELPCLSRRCRWEMYGVPISPSGGVTASLCSAILIFWENLPIWRRSN